MSHQDKLGKIFGSVARQMQERFECTKGVVRHKGLKGKAAERNVVASYLDQYLPGTVDVRQNVEIISSAGEHSTECDVAICDASTPPLWSDEAELVPVEFLHGLIEVKSVLSTDGLRETWRKTAAVKRYAKTAWIRKQTPEVFHRAIQAYGKQFDYFPTAGFLFAYTSSATLQSLGNVMWELAQDTEPEHRLDGVWILNKGSITWVSSTSGEWLTAQAGEPWMRLLTPPPGGSPLPLMTMQLQGVFQSVFMRPFRIGDYMGDLPFGTGHIIGPENPTLMPPWLTDTSPNAGRDNT
ncbi:hypothetical protein GPA10_37280 [Streptomyces sp. p1417]|uniref:DUF6602 domain-containing protein n=1 Tax=Streptomyces typhae TaxID=2681492 RepID=A0A6L6X8X1_9ACTN|nr:DUF6602 domain-containing protein [Streptomyces typhae]MVO90256.1 hypothetical protein [Streptomyces typhae]